MPQWFRDRAADSVKYPDERWRASCPRASAPLLLRFDHHVVRIHGRPALLRTYYWAAQAATDWPTELQFEVSFTYATGHPLAPAEVQEVIDTLAFTPIEPSSSPQ